MPVGYFAAIGDADDYFTNERLETDLWPASPTTQTKAIMNAYNRLYYDPKFTLPTYAEASTAMLVILQKANAEMAYYLLEHLADEDRRKGIQVQATTDAGIVKEVYDKENLFTLPVPPFVLVLLKPWTKPKPFAVVDVGRDEELSAKDNGTEF